MVISIYVKVAEHSFCRKMLYPFAVNVFTMHEEDKQPGEKRLEIISRNLFCFRHL